MSRLPSPVERCRITDDRLSELSGLVSDGTSWYAVGDGGSSLKVHVLDPQNCAVRDVRTAGIDPYDVEDLALTADGDLWLADTGDNSLRRDTVALHVMPAGGGASLYRLTYPDGPHDAEALMLGSDGVPYIVTKEPLGSAGIYRPTAELVAGQTVPLGKVGSLTVSATQTPGGPMAGSIDSVLVTGAAMSHDGTVVAVRTYTDAYLYPASGGGIIAALQREPLRVPLPHEPQGEALAFEPDGTVLSASEGSHPVRAIPGAVQAARAHGMRGSSSTPPQRTTSSAQAPEGTSDGMASARGDRHGLSATTTLLIAGGLAAVIVAVAGRLRRRTR
ncbi:hypothetical protein [Haloactinomyces albus]|uniref:Uncharacterized protein n=1 Tax=Haloactinomyces albus TaxID=1352928 RepID=A0AAE3ZFW2_9ACTN|nr:hypothetical protein [Haloactinomyces albus]MDR7303136.1 hypothetical protein [Haloactinomyces albus]